MIVSPGPVSVADFTFLPMQVYSTPMQAYRLKDNNKVYGVAIGSVDIKNGLLRVQICHDLCSSSFIYSDETELNYQIYITLKSLEVELAKRRTEAEAQKASVEKQRQEFIEKLSLIKLGPMNV